MSVEIGSVWEDRDSRMSGRRVRVLRIEGDRAVCRNIHDHAERQGGETRIRIVNGTLPRFRRVELPKQEHQ